QRDQLSRAIAALDDQLGNGVNQIIEHVNEHLPVIAALSARTSGSSSARVNPKEEEKSTAVWSDLEPCTPTKQLVGVESEPDIIDSLKSGLAGSGLHFTTGFLTNIYV